MKFWFKKKNGKRQLLGEFETEQDCIKEMHRFCAERGFKIYYTRFWTEDNDGSEEKWFDVGSWSEFFIITKEAN